MKMNRASHIALLFTALLVLQTAFGQKADAVIDRKEILIGEQAIISLSAPFDKGKMPKVNFPNIGDTLVKAVEVLRLSSIDTLETGDDVKESRLEQKVYITSFDTGFYAIPPFMFEIDGVTVSTEAFLLTVNTVEIDTTKGIVDIRDIYEVEVGWKDYLAAYWPYAAGALGVAILIAALVIAVQRVRKRRREARAVVIPQVPRKAPHLLAIEAIEKTQREKAYLRNRVKQYHTEITDAIRDYIEAVFDMPAHELTSRQILDRLRYADLPQGEIQRLKSILNRADMVKFAKESPESDENDRAATDALAFVNGIHRHLGAIEQSKPGGAGGAHE